MVQRKKIQKIKKYPCESLYTCDESIEQRFQKYPLLDFKVEYLFNCAHCINQHFHEVSFSSR